MDTNRILTMARRQVSNLESIAENIYRGTLNIEDKVAGVYYFDLNNSIPDNFEDYQEQLLSDEFYNNPGTRQWNYYLFMLNDTLSPEQKKVIERDDRYARKFVLNEGEFEDFFKIEESGAEIQSSIVSRWKQKLDEADLQEVYGGETYVDVFERYCSNNTRKNKADLKKGPVARADQVSFINRVTMKENYRRFPKEVRDIAFGKVNLVHGINGVGKTSTFEAIELVLCGATFRNKYQLNKEGCVEAELNNNGTVIKYQTKNTSLYQGRDLGWYANTNTRGNTLYNSFNRFNYFNADAAQQFSGGGNEDEIRDALFNIVLGPEYTYIQERSNKMLARISPAYRKMQTELDQAQKRLSDAQIIIVQYSEPRDLKSLIDGINELVKTIGFVNGSFEFSSQASLIEQENNRLQVGLAYFASDSFSINSLDQFRGLQTVYDQKNGVFAGLLEKIRKYNVDLSEHQKTNKRLESDLDVLIRALGYLQDARFLELRGLNDKTRKASFERQRKQFVKDAIGELPISQFQSDEPIVFFLQDLRNQYNLSISERDRSNSIITEEIGKFGKLEGVLKEIKLAGAQFLEMVPDACDCPMCQSTFDRSVLEERIHFLNEVEIENDGSHLLTKARNEVKVINERLNHLNRQIEIIDKAYSAYKVYNGDTNSRSLTEVVRNLIETIGSIVQTDAEIQLLRETADFARLSGKSEQNLRSIESSLEAVLGRPIELMISDKDFLSETKDGIEKELSAQEQYKVRITEERYAVGLEVKKLLGYPAEEQMDAKAAEEALKKEGDRLATYQRYFEDLSVLVTLDPLTSITALKVSSDLLKQNIASHREASKAEVEVNAARKEQKENEKFILENRVKHERVKKAFDVLSELCKSDDSQSHLKEFFDQNFKEINDIFMSIHMPREFVSLRFDGKEITLRDDQNVSRKVTEISTGQRSALALSIFLSLNKKLTNGPEIIMFDDPVAFIDDFNTLSFLDYLRNYVLTSGRQIFFATANARLAGLFEKKFSFLGDGDFVNIRLDR